MKDLLLKSQNTATKGTKEEPLLQVTADNVSEMRKSLKPFFRLYDENNDKMLSRAEFAKLMVDLKEWPIHGHLLV